MDHVAHAAVTIAAPAERVWDVLTGAEPRPEIMFGARTVTNWQPGHPIVWRGEWQGRPFEDHGEVLAADRPHRLVVTHFSPMSGQPDVPESYHRLDYRLEAAEGGTRVTLDQDNNPTAEAAEHSAANWRTMLDGLKAVAEASS